MGQEADMIALLRLPYPWPPTETYLMCGGEANGLQFEVFALKDGRIELKTPNAITSFISQPVDVRSDRPTWTSLRMTLTASASSIEISGQPLLRDTPEVSRLLLTSAQGLVPQGFSVEDNSRNTACQTWIQNRKSKFSKPTTPRPNRRLKTIKEQANDFVVSIYRLRVLQQQVFAGNDYLLGTLAGEMRACIYWRQDAKPDRNYNPLLLRMANLAEMPLPVYVTPGVPPPQLADQIVHLTPTSAPRIERMFATDQLCDLQEGLASTVLRLGQPPGRVITALEAIKELAHTMGAAHYDEDASEFLEVMRALKSADTDQLTIFMCKTADTVASLSEWVLSELNTRNLIV